MSATTQTSIELSWTAPDHNSLTGYLILRGDAADNLQTLVADTGNLALSHTDSTAEASTTYHYAVVPLSVDGNSLQSTAVSATTPAPPPETSESTGDDSQVKGSEAGDSKAGGSKTGDSQARDDQARDDQPVTPEADPSGDDEDLTQVVEPDPDEEPETSQQQSTDLVDLTTVENVLASTINIATTSTDSSRSHTLNQGDQVAYRVGAIPNNHGNGDGYEITGGQIALKDFSRADGDRLRVRMFMEYSTNPSSALIRNIRPMSPLGTNPLLAYFSTGVDETNQIVTLSSPAPSGRFNGGAYPVCTVDRDRTANANGSYSDSNHNDCRTPDYSQYINGGGFYIVIQALSGSFSVLHSGAGHDTQVSHDLNAELKWSISASAYSRGPSGWNFILDPDTTMASVSARMLVTGVEVDVVAQTSPPPPDPVRPAAPANSVSAYQLGRWQSESLSEAGSNNDAVYKVNLARDTSYRLELRFASHYGPSTAYDASVLFEEYRIDNPTVFSGDGLKYVVNAKFDEQGNLVLDADGNPVFDDVPIRLRSTLVFGTSAFGGISNNAIHQDFRTPAVLDANGPESCNEDVEVDYDCIHAYEYPHHYYLNLGTGIHHSKAGDYGSMQFRITRLSDQTISGMSQMRESRLERPSGNAGVNASRSYGVHAPPNKVKKIDISGDVDWFNITHPGQTCGYTITGVDLDGATASGLRMMAFDLPFNIPKASTSRGSYSSSLSGILSPLDQMLVDLNKEKESGITPEPDEVAARRKAAREKSKTLEVTGSSPGRYAITETCVTETVTVLEDPNVPTTKWRGYDDYKFTRVRGANAPTTYGAIDVSGRSSASATGTLSYADDSDYFKITAAPGKRYSITLTGTRVRLNTPGHADGESVTLDAVDLPKAKVWAKNCSSNGSEPGNTGASVLEFHQDSNDDNTKVDTAPHSGGAPVPDRCFYVDVVPASGGTVGGYRVTITDEGPPPHPAWDDRHSPLMYDWEDLFLFKKPSVDGGGLKAFINSESLTEDGATYSPSSMFGSIPGNAKLDTSGDFDLLRTSSLSTGPHEVVVKSDFGPSHPVIGEARKRAANVLPLAVKVWDSDAEYIGLNGDRHKFTVGRGGEVCEKVGTAPYTYNHPTRTMNDPGGATVDQTDTNGDTVLDSSGNPVQVPKQVPVKITTQRDTFGCRVTTFATFDVTGPGQYYVSVSLDFLRKGGGCEHRRLRRRCLRDEDGVAEQPAQFPHQGKRKGNR